MFVVRAIVFPSVDIFKFYHADLCMSEGGISRLD